VEEFGARVSIEHIGDDGENGKNGNGG